MTRWNKGSEVIERLLDATNSSTPADAHTVTALIASATAAEDPEGRRLIHR
jgi:hypothetical protein